MQLNAAPRPGALRRRLAAAACTLLAAGLPVRAHAQESAPWQFEGSALLYSERERASVVEPVARITRLFPDGQRVTARLGFDAMTGASPSGAAPSGRVQTVTTPSGMLKTTAADQIPLDRFQDVRGSLDLEWVRPLGAIATVTTGGHLSREKDYQSLGASGKLALELDQRLTTITLGGGVNHDGVFPIGGTPVGLTDGSLPTSDATQRKDVKSVLAGVSRVLTRRWLVGVSWTRNAEEGYLTEPYKRVSRIDPATGYTVDALTERRPDRRQRTAWLTNSVYHLSRDVLYLSHRAYRDDWGVRSQTFDVKVRRDLDADRFVQPHARWYRQTSADFFTFGLPDGSTLPAYASADERLGPLRSLTLGATYGFRLGATPGQFTVRAEYLRQWGDGHPPDAIGVQRTFDHMPPVSIGEVLVGYSVGF